MSRSKGPRSPGQETTNHARLFPPCSGEGRGPVLLPRDRLGDHHPPSSRTQGDSAEKEELGWEVGRGLLLAFGM